MGNLFGSSADLEADTATPKASTGGSKARQPSFGGVAALFGDEDDEPAPVVASTKTHKTGANASGRRQASFGGVAALFGDEDGPPPAVSKPAPKSSGSKKRDPSFSGVANLFGDEEDDEQEEEQQPSSSYNTEHESVGALRELPKVNRTKKRDPSFGGVADLFNDDGGDDDDDAPAPKFEVKINPTQDKQISALQAKVEISREKAIELEGELAQVQTRNKKLEDELEKLREEKNELLKSKIRLITNTAEEIQRMRELMHEMSEANQKNKEKSATIA